MLRKLINSLKELNEKLCEKLSSKEIKQLEKGVHSAESWCSEQTSEQINTLTEDNAVLAYRYYLTLAGALLLKDATPKDIELIKKEANRAVPINISKSVEELIYEDEALAKTIKTKNRLDEIKLC